MSPFRWLPASRALVVVLGAVALGAAAACGAPEPPPELVTGTVASDQVPVSLPEYPPSSVGDGDEWPAACALLTDTEFLAVLPQATGLRHDPRGAEFSYKLVGLGTYETPRAPRGNPYAQPRSIDVPEKSCEIWSHLPSSGEDGLYATAKITIDMVGSPDTVQYFWSRGSSDRDLPDAFGADECYQDGDVDPETANVSTFRCRKGRVSVEIVGIIDDVEDDNQVRLPGDAVASTREAVVDWYRSRVMPQFVAAVVRRLP